MTDWPFPAPEDDGGAAHLVPDYVVPSVPLIATDGATVILSEVCGVSVVFVYPWTGRPGVANPPAWDDIPGAHGSTPEADGFRDAHDAFLALGAAVFGLSSQESAWQRELADRLQLPFQLLSDAGFVFADAMRLPRFETGGDRYLKRLTLVIRDGQLRRVFYPVHPPSVHAGEVLTWLKSAALS